MPAHAISQCKQPSVAVHLVRRGGGHMAVVILILLSKPSRVGKLSEFQIMHRALCYPLPVGIVPNSSWNWPTLAPIHYALYLQKRTGRTCARPALRLIHMLGIRLPPGSCFRPLLF